MLHKDMRLCVRGVELAASVGGQGPHFIWCHGITWSRALETETGLFDWSSASEVVTLVRYDARGHGASGASFDPADYRWDNLALDLLGIADALGANRFVAGGASMGCATALYAALAAPERVRALVLAIPPTAWETRPAQVTLYETGAALVQARGVGEFVARLHKQPFPGVFADNGAQLRELHLRRLEHMPEAVLPAILLGAARSDFPAREKLATLRVPALVLTWAGDPAHPVSTAEALHRLLPDSKLEVAETFSQIQRWPIAVQRFLAECVDRTSEADG